MTNAYYNPTGAPAQGAAITSAVVRTEFAAIQAGFDKMPALTGNGNKLVYINAAETAQGAVGSVEAITFLASPTSTNLAALVSDETGSGSLVFNTSPVFTTDISINSAAGTPLLKFTQGGTRTGSVECSGGTISLRNQSLNVIAVFRQGVSSPTSYVTLAASDTGLPTISTSAVGTSLVLGAGGSTVLTLSGSGANSVTIANSATNPTIGTSSGSIAIGGGSGSPSVLVGTNAGTDYLVVQGQTSLPYIYCAGASADINTGISSKGTGSLNFYTNSAAQTQLQVHHTVLADRFLKITGGNSAVSGHVTLNIGGTAGGHLAITPAVVCSASLTAGTFLSCGSYTSVYTAAGIPANGNTNCAVSFGSEGISFSMGNGTPSHSPPNGSVYANSAGGAMTTLYQRRAGSWVALL